MLLPLVGTIDHQPHPCIPQAEHLLGCTGQEGLFDGNEALEDQIVLRFADTKQIVEAAEFGGYRHGTAVVP